MSRIKVPTKNLTPSAKTFDLTSSVGRVPERTEEQGDVEVFRGVLNAKHHGNLGVEAAGARRPKVRLRVERDTVGALHQLL